MEQEREEQRDAREQEDGRDDDRRPSRREADADEREVRTEDDVYRGICGGCERPVSAFAGHEGGHEGSCLWRGGPWHPACREADKTAEVAPAALSGARP